MSEEKIWGGARVQNDEVGCGIKGEEGLKSLVKATGFSSL